MHVLKGAACHVLALYEHGRTLKLEVCLAPLEVVGEDNDLVVPKLVCQELKRPDVVLPIQGMKRAHS